MLIDVMAENRAAAPPPGPRRLFGIEIEYENAGILDEGMYPGWRSDWQIAGDGSLRTGGLELISPPMTLNNAMRAFRRATNFAIANGWQATARTGIHVHVDVRDLHFEQLGGVLAAYSAFEPLLFAMCGEDREAGIYCVPWYRAPDQAQLVPQLIADYRRVSIGRGGQAVKYSALFLGPLRRFGTIEFRQAPTWMNHHEMRRWLSAINRIVEWGRIHTAESVLERCGTDITPLAREVLGWTIADIEDPEALIDEVDSLGTVAEMIPNTYEASDWQIEVADGATEGIGYHQQQAGVSMFDDIPVPQDPPGGPMTWRSIRTQNPEWAMPTNANTPEPEVEWIDEDEEE